MKFKILKNCNYNNLNKKIEEILEDFQFSFKGKIFIKPNFSGRAPIIPGENTDPKFLDVFSDYLLNKGAEEIIIGHGALLGTSYKKFPFKDIIKEGGFSFLSKKRRVTLLNLDKEDREIINYNDFSFSVPKIIKNSDFYINLSKVKTHMETTVTLSLKNQMGLLPLQERIEMHMHNLEKLIASLGKVVKPDLNIIDGIEAMEGNGPHHGETKRLGIIAASNDMLKLDSALSSCLGFDFKKIKHILEAKRLGVGEYPTEKELEEIISLKIEKLKPASQYYRFGRNIYVWPTTACSRCIVALNESGKIVKRRPIQSMGFIKKAFLGKKKINIVIGKAEGLDLPKNEKCITIGRCTECFSKRRNIENLNMCPPTVEKTLEHIKKKIKDNG